MLERNNLNVVSVGQSRLTYMLVLLSLNGTCGANLPARIYMDHYGSYVMGDRL